MRLGQLARKLALRPDQIVEFLAKKNIQIVEGSNTRLEDDQVALVVEKFAPHGFDILQQEPEPQTAIAPEEPAIAPPNEPLIETIEVLNSPASDSGTITNEEKTEVIKAPKVELSGLKVLGKIDLPEPKKKEMPQPEPQPGGGEKPTPRERPRASQNRSAKTNPRSAQNPMALQREREELEAQRKREAAKDLEREKRAQHYFNKVKVITPVKAPKRDHMVEIIDAPAPKPKTLLGRFFRWFTT